MIFKNRKDNPYLVAEIGWNFLGNLSLAKKMITMAKKSGADAVKFQIWNPKYLKKGPWDKDGRKKIYEKAYLSKKKYKLLYNFAVKHKLICFASVWSNEGIKTLASISKKIVKIPSPEAYNIQLIEDSLKTFDQVIISAGCLKLSELKKLEKYKNNSKLIILHCVSSYPVKPENTNFEKFFYLKKKFKKVGYSGHFHGIEDAFFAIFHGAILVEKHFTTNNNLQGRDNKFALLPKDFEKLDKVRKIYYQFNKSNGLGLQENEKDIYKNYRGRWTGE